MVSKTARDHFTLIIAPFSGDVLFVATTCPPVLSSKVLAIKNPKPMPDCAVFQQTRFARLGAMRSAEYGVLTVSEVVTRALGAGTR